MGNPAPGGGEGARGGARGSEEGGERARERGSEGAREGESAPPPLSHPLGDARQRTPTLPQPRMSTPQRNSHRGARFRCRASPCRQVRRPKLPHAKSPLPRKAGDHKHAAHAPSCTHGRGGGICTHGHVSRMRSKCVCVCARAHPRLPTQVSRTLGHGAAVFGNVHGGRPAP